MCFAVFSAFVTFARMSQWEYYYNEEVLGRILIRRSERARCASLKIKGGEVILTLPPGGSVAGGLEFLRSKYDWVKKHLAATKKAGARAVFDERTEFSTLTFSLKIVRSDGDDFMYDFSQNHLTLFCPREADIYDSSSQERIRATLVMVMREEAKRVLPARLADLARKFGFSYGRVSIRSSRSRWGSRSSSGSINLSLFLMTLPPHLVDYVLLHELCHTRVMSHGPAFWALMREVTDGMSDVWDKELDKYRTFF